MNNKRALFVPLISIVVPILLFILLVSIYPSIDGYLLTGLCSSIFLFLFVLLVPIMFIMLIYDRGKRVKSIISLFNRFPIFLAILVLLFTIIESVIIYRGYSYLMDITFGPHEALINDAIINKEYEYRNSYSYYINGNINGKKINYIIRSDSNIIEGNHNVKIYYYKYIKEVYKLEYK